MMEASCVTVSRTRRAVLLHCCRVQTEGRPPFADVSLTLWPELAMLTALTVGQLENVRIAVPLQDYAVGFVAVQVQEQAGCTCTVLCLVFHVYAHNTVLRLVFVIARIVPMDLTLEKMYDGDFEYIGWASLEDLHPGTQTLSLGDTGASVTITFTVKSPAPPPAPHLVISLTSSLTSEPLAEPTAAPARGFVVLASASVGLAAVAVVLIALARRGTFAKATTAPVLV